MSYALEGTQKREGWTPRCFLSPALLVTEYKVDQIHQRSHRPGSHTLVKGGSRCRCMHMTMSRVTYSFLRAHKKSYVLATQNAGETWTVGWEKKRRKKVEWTGRGILRYNSGIKQGYILTYSGLTREIALVPWTLISASAVTHWGGTLLNFRHTPQHRCVAQGRGVNPITNDYTTAF